MSLDEKGNQAIEDKNMATLLRFSRHSRIIFNNLARSRTKHLPCCQISTSDKKKDVLTHVEPPMTQPQHKTDELKELEEHFADADPHKLKVHSFMLHLQHFR